MTQYSHAAGAAQAPRCLDEGAAPAGAVNPRSNAACEADDCEMMYAPVHQFLALLVQGWRFCFIVEPIQAHHGRYSMWMWRP